MKTKNIKQIVEFNSDPGQIFEMLMSSKRHSEITGSNARISKVVGRKISAYDGSIVGENLEIIKNKKIVQKWKCWPEDIYSIATFKFEKIEKGNEIKTKLIFTQVGVPENHWKDISKGWYEYYWDRIKQNLGRK